MHEQSLKDVRSNFSACIGQAEDGIATAVTRYGKKVAVLIGYEHYCALTKGVPTFAEMLLSIPDDVEIARDPTPSQEPEP